MRKALDYILVRLPDHSAKIMELYNRDEDFRILCEDYLASARALEEFRQNVIKDREFERDFLDIHLELEKEINGLLSDIK